MSRILIGLVFAVCALAQMPGPGGHMGPMGPMGPGGPHMFGQGGEMRPPEELKDFLGLEDKQVEALQQIARKAHQSMRAESEAMQAKQRTLNDLVEKATDASAAGKLLFEIEAARKGMPEIHKKAHADALAVLNNAQQTKLKELRKETADRAAAQQAAGLNLLYPRMPMGPMHSGPGRRGPRQGNRFGPGPGQGPGGPMQEGPERPK
jgi:Spy/CpxP family protein refolding chaperone